MPHLVQIHVFEHCHSVHSVWFQPTVEIMVWRGWKWIRMKERMVPRKKNKGKWLRFNKMLRDNLWFSWAAMEFVKWKNNVNNGIRLLSKLFFLLSLKKIHSLFLLFIQQKKDHCCVSVMSLSHWDKPQRSSLQSVRNNGTSNYQTERGTVRERHRNAGTMKCKTIKNTEEEQTDTEAELQVEG